MTRLLVGLMFCTACWAEERVIELTVARVPAAEVFPGAGAEADLGPAPAPGVRRRVTRSQLLRWARQAGLEMAPEELPEFLTLVRKQRRLEQAEAVELAERLLAEAAGVSGVEVAPAGYAAPEIPDGALEWSLVGLPSSLESPVRVGLRWRDGGGRSGVESLMAQVRVRARALTAVRDQPAGTEARAEDFQLAEVDLAALGQGYLTRIEPDASLVLERSLGKGEALSEDIIERRPQVERGALVELVAVVGAIRLRAPGRAEGEGSAGDLVPFRNLATNQRVVARVTGPKAAEVVTR